MRNGPPAPDFDWVTARHNCTLPNEFERLRDLVEKDVSTRRRYLPNDNSMDFNFNDGGPDHFGVMRSPVEGFHGKTYGVAFLLRDDHILVEDTWAERRLTLTLTLNDAGECQFVIDGEGEYQRWQIARRALCPIFFQGPTERKSTST